MTDRELPGTAELKAVAQTWRANLAAAEQAEEAAWEPPADSQDWRVDWRERAQRCGAITELVAALDEALTHLDTLDASPAPVPSDETRIRELALV